MASTALLTDRYELTMLDAALRNGVTAHRAVFEVFARTLPAGRRYGVVAGTGRLLERLAAFRFGDAELGWLESEAVVSVRTLEWLANFHFSGSILGYAEGELFFPSSPILTVDAPFGEGLLLETLVLSVLNHDSAVAAAGARMVTAAGGRPLVDAGGRRTHEEAAVAAARAAYLVGFVATSNLEAGRRWGVPTGGTSAHAFTLAHLDERAAFMAQVASHGPSTTLLVDTFDIEQGIRTAVEIAGAALGAIRIDSGDLGIEACRARALLDGLGATSTRIVVSGDLDETRIAALAGTPVDQMLVGTQLVMGSGAPTAGLVYKIVAVSSRSGDDAPLVNVAKRSPGKVTTGGVKVAYRRPSQDGRVGAEIIGTAHQVIRHRLGDARPLQVRLMEAGDPLRAATLQEARLHHQVSKAELTQGELGLSPGPPALELVRLGDAD